MRAIAYRADPSAERSRHVSRLVATLSATGRLVGSQISARSVAPQVSAWCNFRPVRLSGPRLHSGGLRRIPGYSAGYTRGGSDPLFWAWLDPAPPHRGRSSFNVRAMFDRSVLRHNSKVGHVRSDARACGSARSRQGFARCSRRWRGLDVPCALPWSWPLSERTQDFGRAQIVATPGPMIDGAR
jgi:hypothetical protein